ncbi:hypothetical protein I3842_03G113000 [Carya illinoinensis]|uniref:Glycoside hydrolase family 31 N-terminal domain-containing protein n=1 Tax=Carya illinoinensis TaxID=32201 RepID=A0A922JUP8_CARIL|nr:hypothetical protein I3842_03G113000 [Carya illinoinensis]
MKPLMRNLNLFLFLLLSLHFISVLSWKKDEFRNCNQTPFCKRARARKPGSCSLLAHHVTISDGELTAKLLPKNHETSEDHHGINPLLLTLSLYQDGVLRLKIDEDPSLGSPKKRFEVPDVIVPEFSDKKLWLQRISTETIDGDTGPSSIVHLADGYEAVLRHDPFEVYVREKGSVNRVISLNSHGLFDFEQLTAKGEGEEWEESFRGHTDTRPYGPQSISFDVSFYAADFVYGIPEHATSLALKPTRGPGVEYSEPYRLFNLDVFEYIPYDVLWLDIEHTDGKRYFTWDRMLFPHPEEMQRKLAAKGRHMVTIVDPHIKRDDSYNVHKEATKKGYYVKDASGNDFDGWCWSGSSSYPDMLNPQIRSWWADRFSFEHYVGSTPSLYIWNDMNEPSVFNGPELTMPRDALHYGDVENRELHNAYGYYFHMATANGLVKRGEGKDRPFVLSRALFAGSQRHGAVWTGDNTADWDHLRVSVPMVLTLGLTGLPFSGADVGGFFGNPEPKLLVRWYQLGAYHPFFRAHAHHDTKRREPWLFGERNTELIRDAIRVRYMLLPYFYTLFREANTSGVPVVRPLWMEFPSEEATFSNDEAFMVGNSILVQGIYTERAKVASVYLPGRQSWYDLRTGTSYRGGMTHKMTVSEETIPAFQRAGTIIPRKDRFRRSSTQMVNDPYTLVIALNSSQAAEGELYVDDGKSFEFEHGAYIHRRFVLSDGKLTSVNLAPASSGKSRFSSETVIERIIVLGHTHSPKGALIEATNQKVEIGLGPLWLQWGRGSTVVTVRKPGIRIADDWTIKVL